MDLLIADDDPITRLNLRQLLEGEGYRCAEADNGQEAVDLARQDAPRLILLDVMMPSLDGFSAARALRSDPRTRDVPIVFVTGRDDRSARTKVRLTGDAALVNKPVDEYELLDLVNIALKVPYDHDSQ